MDLLWICANALHEGIGDVHKERFYEELDELYDKLPQYDTNIVLGGFNEVVGKEVFYKPTIGIHSLHEESSENGVRKVNFATTRNLRIIAQTQL
jgi:hypothetical protein